MNRLIVPPGTRCNTQGSPYFDCGKLAVRNLAGRPLCNDHFRALYALNEELARRTRAKRSDEAMAESYDEPVVYKKEWL